MVTNSSADNNNVTRHQHLHQRVYHLEAGSALLVQQITILSMKCLIGMNTTIFKFECNAFSQRCFRAALGRFSGSFGFRPILQTVSSLVRRTWLNHHRRARTSDEYHKKAQQQPIFVTGLFLTGIIVRPLGTAALSQWTCTDSIGSLFSCSHREGRCRLSRPNYRQFHSVGFLYKEFLYAAFYTCMRYAVDSSRLHRTECLRKSATIKTCTLIMSRVELKQPVRTISIGFLFS